MTLPLILKVQRDQEQASVLLTPCGQERTGPSVEIWQAYWKIATCFHGKFPLKHPVIAWVSGPLNVMVRFLGYLHSRLHKYPKLVRMARE